MRLMFFPVTSEIHPVGGQFFQDVFVDLFGWIMPAVRIDRDDLSVLNLDISSAGDGSTGEDAGMTNLWSRELIKQVEITGGIHHIVVYIVMFALGIEYRVPRVVVDESVLDEQSSLFALFGV